MDMINSSNNNVNTNALPSNNRWPCPGYYNCDLAPEAAAGTGPPHMSRGDGIDDDRSSSSWRPRPRDPAVSGECSPVRGMYGRVSADRNIDDGVVGKNAVEMGTSSWHGDSSSTTMTISPSSFFFFFCHHHY
jgi:hypothetical protein